MIYFVSPLLTSIKGAELINTAWLVISNIIGYTE